MQLFSVQPNTPPPSSNPLPKKWLMLVALAELPLNVQLFSVQRYAPPPCTHIVLVKPVMPRRRPVTELLVSEQLFRVTPYAPPVITQSETTAFDWPLTPAP